ncbi:MAG: DUF411 domain-containing protein [Phormidesmis sp.]
MTSHAPRPSLRTLAYSLIVAVCATAFFGLTQPAALARGSVSQLTVYRSPTCGCCEEWVAHMKSAGFQIDDNVTSQMETIRQTYGVPEKLSSCHTAIIDGYVVEGHVPAADVQRLLSEKPDVVGLTAPGMPVGAPGMEMKNRSDPYTVFAFTPDATLFFADHN